MAVIHDPAENPFRHPMHTVECKQSPGPGCICKLGGSHPVRAPMHYVNGRAYEPRRVIRDWGLNFNLGNVVKYVARAGRKADEPKLQALEKAIQYLQWEIEAVRIEEQENK